MAQQGRIPESVIEEIKRRCDIASIIEEYLPLSRKNHLNYFGLCPFHHEDTPSFSVNPSKEIFYCFGCHKGGDVFKFIMEIEKLTYVEAVRFLANKVGVAIETRQDPREQEREKERLAIRKLYLEAARFYYRAMQNDPQKKAQNYCLNRSISRSSQLKFGLGYAPDQWDGLYKHLQKLELFPSKKIIENSGLFKQNSKGGFYDLLRDRLIFPVIDKTGQVIAFGGRIIGEGQPKYINSPETPIYTKGNHLYGFNFAKSNHKNHVLLVEGYLDVITCHEAGFTETVGVLGTALTPQQVKLLHKNSKEVIICFDADNAGQQAMQRSLSLLVEADVPVRVLLLHGPAKDPDEFIKKFGKEQFQVAIDKAMSVLDYRLHLAKQKSMNKDVLDLLQFKDHYLQALLYEKSPVVVETYLNRLALQLRCSIQTLINEFAQLQKNHRGSRSVFPTDDSHAVSLNQGKSYRSTDAIDLETSSKHRPLSLAEQQEIELLAALIQQPLLTEDIHPDLETSIFTNTALGELFTYCQNKENTWNNLTDLLTQVENMIQLNSVIISQLRAHQMQESNSQIKPQAILRLSLQILQANAANQQMFYAQAMSAAPTPVSPELQHAFNYWLKKNITYRQALEKIR